MKVIILSDIHGNFQALEAVLNQVAHDVLVCCGDVVVDFPYPEECVTLLRRLEAHCCLGNNDRFVAHHMTPSEHIKPPHLRYAAALDRVVELTQRLISGKSRAFLAGLSREHRFSLDGVSFYLNHTGPGLPIDQYMPVDTPQDELLRIYRHIQEGVIVTGHTHIPYVKNLDGRLLINPGSVGEPRDGDPRACYATFDTANGQVHIGRIAYDAAQTMARLKALGFPNFPLNCLRHGRLPEDPDDAG